MKKNNILNELGFLIGNWKTKVYNASFLKSRSEIIAGKTSFEWFENETFLVMKSETTKDGPPASVSIINLDDTNGQGAMIYYDERGVSRIYQMSFAGNVWKLWRDAPGFNQKFEGVISNDRKIMKASWFAMEDEKTWVHDFDIEYVKFD